MAYRHDLLSQVHEVCRLHWLKRGQQDVQIEELETNGFSHLRVSYGRGSWTEHQFVGVHEGQVDMAVLDYFRSLTDDSIELVYRGDVPADVADRAGDLRVWLRPIASYQQDLWVATSYLRTQNTLLVTDPEYPLNLYVDKNWSALGAQGVEGQTVLPAIMHWLSTDGPRFVLVLGDFGTGKTFLLRTIADALAQDAGLVPVLVTMRDLEKGRTLDELLAQHMARANEDPFHTAAFRYLLAEGKVVLLFDGFDELALRTSYDRVPQHFATLREAAGGSAKVVVTSRHQYFATDEAVRTALGDEVHRMQGSRIIRLFPLRPAQRRELVVRTFGDDGEAEEFIETMRDVPNLLDLATNPRMLAFMVGWYRQGILTKSALARSAGESMTAGNLYDLLITTWLDYEVKRQTMAGALTPLLVRQRKEALQEAAMLMWRTGERSLSLDDVGEAADRIRDLARLEMRPGEAAHTVGSSTVLVRTRDERFAFIHQSMMEWFVADAAKDALTAGTIDTLLADNELTGPMVDFWRDLAGREPIVRWALGVTARPDFAGPAAKANAALVLQRLHEQAASVNLSRQNLRGRDLSSQNLDGATIHYANLSGAVLPRTMRGASLHGTALVNARLVGANLTGADLTLVNLSRAKLAGADLTGARLDQVSLERAVLLGMKVTDEQLAEARTYGAAFPDAELTPQFSGRSTITALTALPGDLLVSGHEDGTLRIHDITALRTLSIIPAHDGPVRALAGADNGWIASACDNEIRVWDSGSGREVRRLTGQKVPVTHLAMDPDSHWVAAADRDSVNVWESAGPPTRIHTNVGEVRALAAASDGTLVVVDYSVRRWLGGQDKGATFLADGPAMLVADIRGLLAQPDRGTVWVCAAEGVIEVTNTARWTHTGQFTMFAAGMRSTWYAAANRERITFIPTNQQTIDVISCPGTDFLAMDPDGRWLASAGGDSVVRVWASDKQPKGSFSTGDGQVTDLAADPVRGEWLAVSSMARCKVWDLPSGHVSMNRFDPPSYALAADPTTGRLTAGDALGVVRVDRSVTYQTSEPVLALDHSSDGRWLAAGTRRSLLLFDLRTGDIATHTDHVNGHRALVFDHHGLWLASAGTDGLVRIWDRPPTQRDIGHPTTLSGVKDVTSLAVDRHCLVTGGREGVAAWIPRASEVVATYPSTGNRVTALVARADTWWLAGGDNRGYVRVWSTRNQKVLYTIHAHVGPVRALAVDPLGRWFASAGSDGATRLWNPATGAFLATLVSAEDGWVAVQADGRYKAYGKPENVWWSAGLCRFDASDLDDLAPLRRIPEDGSLDLGK
jgi:WD40 repeat protein